MKTKAISSLSPSEVETLIDRIPYFKDLSFNDYYQYQLLLSHSRLIQLEPGEILLRRGKTGNKIYFLASGNVDVFSEDTPGDKALNQLTSGEIIGALSVINDQPRTATLAAAQSYASETTKVIAPDFKICGKLHDFSKVKLTTKIHFLKLVINNIRFKLSTYQKQYPDHRLTQKRHNVGVYTGEPGTPEELDSLAGQAFVLTLLLNNWNKETESNLDVNKSKAVAKPKNKILDFFSKKKSA